MKVEVKTPIWVRGRIHQPGEFVDLPYDVATEGLESGLFVSSTADFSEPEDGPTEESAEEEEQEEQEEQEE